MISITDIKKILTYNPDTGIFHWLPREGDKWFNSRFAGKIAGNKTAYGYWSLSIDRKQYLGHRLAWFLHHGEWPEKLIDHIDRNPLNNAIINLREATSQKNRQNQVNKRGSSGIKGIQQAGNKWEVVVTTDHCKYRLGHYKTLDQAKQVLQKATDDLVWLSKQRSYSLKKPKFTSEQDLDHALLISCFYYDPLVGRFHRRSDNRVVGYREGLYRRIKIKDRRYFEHVLVIFYMTGTWPLFQVDHINGDPMDNRHENLREVSSSENAQNRIAKNGLDNGIRQTRNKIKRWEARITVNYIHHHIGTFDTKEEARQAWFDYRAKLDLFVPYPLRQKAA